MIYDDTSVNTSVKTVAVAPILFDYARAGFEMCERELQLADELACVLEQVACTCTEYAIGIGEFDLVNRIRRSANNTEGIHDSGVHNVAIAFLNADSGAISTQVLDAVDAYDPSKGMNIDSMARDYRAQGWTEEEVQAFLILAKMETIQYQQQLQASYTDEVLDEMLALADEMEQGGYGAMDVYREHGDWLESPDRALGEIASQFTIVGAHSLRLMVFQIQQRQAELDRDLGLQEIALAELTGQPPDVVAEAQARIDAARMELLGGPEIESQIAALEQRQEELETLEKSIAWLEEYPDLSSLLLLPQSLSAPEAGGSRIDPNNPVWQVWLESSENRQQLLAQYKAQRDQYVEQQGVEQELAHIEEELARLRAMDSDTPGLNQQVEQAAEALATEQQQLQDLTSSYQTELSTWQSDYERDVSSIIDLELARLGWIREGLEEDGRFSPRVEQFFSEVEQAIYSANPNDLESLLNDLRTDPELEQLDEKEHLLYIFGAGAPAYEFGMREIEYNEDIEPRGREEVIPTDPRAEMIIGRENFIQAVNPGMMDIISTQVIFPLLTSIPHIFPRVVGILSTIMESQYHNDMAQDPYISEEARRRHEEEARSGMLDLGIDVTSDSAGSSNQNRSSRLNDHSPTLDTLGTEDLPSVRTIDEFDTQGLLMMRAGDTQGATQFIRQQYAWQNYINSNGAGSSSPPPAYTDDEIVAQVLRMLEAGGNPDDISRFLQQETERRNYVNSYSRISDQIEDIETLGQVTGSFSKILSVFSVVRTLENVGVEVDGLLETNDAGADALQTIHNIHNIFSSENDFGPDPRNDNNLPES